MALDSEMPERTDPERIGRYQLCFELASGGMATVYLARADGSSGFEKLVALKRIHRHLAKERDYVEMFLDEARIASRITHANVCSVFDFGESDGEYYIAMEYLVGEPLSRVYRRVAGNPDQRKSPHLPSRMARVIADACEGLHAAHELKDANGDSLNVVHRDVSARNLFVTYDGVVQVVDFGIASARQRVHHTSTGQVKGTFPYMAPEQMTAASVDRRVDIWALGVVLWELLTLKRLFRRDTDVNTMYAVLSDDIRPPSDYRPDVPRELDAIVLKALQRNPEERWQTAREMGQALRQFLGKQKQVLGPAELSEWMHEVFPQGETRKRQLMEIARMADAVVPALPQDDDLSTGSRTDLQFDHTARPEVPSAFSAGLLALTFGAVAMLVIVALGIGEARTDASVNVPVPVAAPTPVQPEEVDLDDTDDGDFESQLLDAVEDPAPEPEPVVVKAPDPPPKKAKRQRRTVPEANGPPGTINLVTSGGWARIYKGGKLIGNTPRRLTLPSGKHKLVLRPFGEGKPKTIWVTVVANKTKKVAIKLN